MCDKSTLDDKALSRADAEGYCDALNGETFDRYSPGSLEAAAYWAAVELFRLDV